MKTILAVSTALCAGFVMLFSSVAQGQNLFVTGGNNSPNSPCIAEFAPNGTSSIFTTNVDDGEGLAFDSTGNLFEADGRSGNIYKFTPGGARSTFASGLNFPYGLVFNSAGNLFTADTSGNIYQFTPQGVRSTFASGLPGSGKEFGYYGLAFDRTGDLFVSDQDSGQIFKITPGGSRSTFASGLNNPTGLAFDSAGNLFLSQGSATYPNGSGTITKFTTNGGSVVFASGNLGNLPYGLVFDSAGNLYLASASIQKFTPDGTRTIFGGGMDSPQFLAFQPVPEPSTSVMVMLGSVAILVNLQRRRRPS